VTDETTPPEAMPAIAPAGSAPAHPAIPKIFVDGGTMRHVVVMTLTASFGLMSVFLVDLADLYFLSLIGEVAVAAAIGYAGTILFFTISVSIGTTIAGSTLVSRAIGTGDRAAARRIATSSLVFAALVTALFTLPLFVYIEAALTLPGADGRAHELATGYMRILLPSTPLLGIGMCASGILRARGDPRRAMYVTFCGAIVNAVLDPVFIFALGLGVNGAAIASVLSRVAFVLVGFHGLVRKHDMLALPRPSDVAADARPIAGIALPAILTNIATPIGNAYMTWAIAAYGVSAVAGWAIVGRILPVAFGGIFALSGAVGPIIGQNYGAGRLDRVRRTYLDGMIFVLVYVGLVWTTLFLARNLLVDIFSASDEGADLIRLFCTVIAGSFIFVGALFVSNAAFNTLRYPYVSTAFNWSRATIGTVPFVWMGSALFGAPGVLWGQAAGSVVFGTLAALVGYGLVTHLHRQPPGNAPPPMWRIALSPFSTGKSLTGI
jgi:MATE family, multidrug efflux pump